MKSMPRVVWVLKGMFFWGGGPGGKARTGGREIAKLGFVKNCCCLEGGTHNNANPSNLASLTNDTREHISMPCIVPLRPGTHFLSHLLSGGFATLPPFDLIGESRQILTKQSDPTLARPLAYRHECETS